MDEESDPGGTPLPGDSRRSVLRVFLERLRRTVEDDPERGRALMERVLGGPIFAALRKRPRGSLVIGLLGETTRRALGAETRLVEMPAHIVHKQQRRWKRAEDHSDLTPEDYRLLPRLIEQPHLVMRFQPARPIPKVDLARRLNLISKVGERYFNAVVGTGKVPEAPEKVGLITFHLVRGGRARVEEMIRQAETGEDGQGVLRNTLPPPARK